ncbi:hypothetical protein [Nocardia sp. NPDC052566]|uniref:hypothetical protein n=1 Tax=Nocardia sp. NPDC052566 TaxID=3364330 RepID=UPI0037C55892
MNSPDAPADLLEAITAALYAAGLADLSRSIGSGGAEMLTVEREGAKATFVLVPGGPARTSGHIVNPVPIPCNFKEKASAPRPLNLRSR